MLGLKKLYREELLQLALLLSLLRVDPESYLGIDIQGIGVGSLDLNNGSAWHSDAHTIIHRPVFIHPKNPDSMLIHNEDDLFEELNSLGRYNRIRSGFNSEHIQAYLLNVEDVAHDSNAAGPSIEADNESRRNITSPDRPTEAQTRVEGPQTAELTQEDMDLIEVLWKQDVDLGFTLVAEPSVKQSSSALTNEKISSADEIEKLKALEAINSTNNQEDSKETQENEDDPWAGLPYTVDLETGEYILTTGNSNTSGQSCGTTEAASPDDKLLDTPLSLENESIGLVEDSLGLDDHFRLEDDFPSDLLSGSLLGDSSVDGLLGSNSLGLPDGFNLEEALQLVGLNEVQSQEIKLEEKKPKDCVHSSEDNLKDEASFSGQEDPENNNMIQPAQFHHPPHSYHRSFQGRVPFMRGMSTEQRWQDMLPTILSIQDGREHFAHPNHSYPGHSINHHSHYDPQRNVLLHNATLAPPIGDMNSTGPYHNVGGSSNFGSAVATSMNLTNSSEPICPVNAYKTEPNDMMYYHTTPPSDTMNQTADGFLSSLLTDEDLMDMAINDGMYTMRLLDNNTSHASGPTGSTNQSAVANGQTNIVNGDERLDASSDSAVSSMGSERVPSLSDGEWMETGSNSSHTQADSHYSMDYASKYRMNYECSYSMSGRNVGSSRCQNDRVPPVAQKKHQMFAKRYFQEQGTGSSIGPSPHAASPMKYEYDTQTVGASAPGHAYSGPIEGAAGPQSELKYSCSLDFSRHQPIGHLPGRTALDHVQHNHTYHLPPDSSGAMQKPLLRDKKSRQKEIDEHLSRDEKRAKSLNVPIAVQDIINLPMDEFNERLSKYDLSEAQLTLIRDIRRRGKNKVAAQNCRKRKLDQIVTLSDQVKEMRDRKTNLIKQRNSMECKLEHIKRKFNLLYSHVFGSMQDSDGNQSHPYEYCLPHPTDSNVLLVPSSKNGTSTIPNHSRHHSMDPKNEPDSESK